MQPHSMLARALRGVLSPTPNYARLQITQAVGFVRSAHNVAQVRPRREGLQHELRRDSHRTVCGARHPAGPRHPGARVARRAVQLGHG
eukprot:633784-Prymnesium_polylepis.2